jgi:hypothetical protein
MVEPVTETPARGPDHCLRLAAVTSSSMSHDERINIGESSPTVRRSRATQP